MDIEQVHYIHSIGYNTLHNIEKSHITKQQEQTKPYKYTGQESLEHKHLEMQYIILQQYKIYKYV